MERTPLTQQIATLAPLYLTQLKSDFAEGVGFSALLRTPVPRKEWEESLFPWGPTLFLGPGSPRTYQEYLDGMANARPSRLIRYTVTRRDEICGTALDQNFGALLEGNLFVHGRNNMFWSMIERMEASMGSLQSIATLLRLSPPAEKGSEAVLSLVHDTVTEKVYVVGSLLAVMVTAAQIGSVEETMPFVTSLRFQLKQKDAIAHGVFDPARN